MPLTRNQQAALQAPSHLPTGSNTCSSFSSRMRSGNGTSNMLSSTGYSQNEQQYQDENDNVNGKMPLQSSHQHMSQTTMMPYKDLGSLAFESPSTSIGVNNAEGLSTHNVLSAIDQNSLLRDSSNDWAPFGGHNSVHGDVYSHHSNPSSHLNSPYFGLPKER
jgi:hypothetical protein